MHPQCNAHTQTSLCHHSSQNIPVPSSSLPPKLFQARKNRMKAIRKKTLHPFFLYPVVSNIYLWEVSVNRSRLPSNKSFDNSEAYLVIESILSLVSFRLILSNS